MSDTPGGDGSGAFLDIEPVTFIDIGQNFNHLAQSLGLVESPDIVRPTFRSGSVNLSTGFFQLAFQKLLRLFPQHKLGLGSLVYSMKVGSTKAFRF